MATINLGQIAAMHIGTTPPSNTKMMWYDDNVGIKLLKYYDIGTTSWVGFDGTGQYVQIGGDTMTGPLILSQDPVAPLEAATKQWVESLIGAANGLGAVLGIDRFTGGVDIGITSGDSIEFFEGSGGLLSSVSTTSSHSWLLPDVSGSLVVGTGTDDMIPRWTGGALGDSTISDDGATAGIGGLDGAAAFYIATLLSTGLRAVSQDDTGGTGVEGSSFGIGSPANNYGGKFVGANGYLENIGVEGEASSTTATTGQSVGVRGIGKRSDHLNIGVEGSFGLADAASARVGVFGANKATSSLASTLVAAIYGGINEGGSYSLTVDQEDIHTAVIGHYKGSQTVAGTKYAGYFKNEVTNAGETNIAGYFSAEGADNNYAIITSLGLSGFGVADPTRQVEISSGIGAVRIGTELATTPYNYDVSLADTAVLFKTDILRGFEHYVNNLRVHSMQVDGAVAIGGHTAESHLHAKHTAAFGGTDGSIRSTMDGAAAYVYAAPNINENIIIENDNDATENSGGLVFKGEDTSGDSHTVGFVSSRFHTKVGATLSGDLLLGVAAAGVLKETMRLHSTGNITVGAETEVSRMAVVSDTDTGEYLTVRQINEGTAARAGLLIQALDSGITYTSGKIEASAAGAVGQVGFSGPQKYFEKAVHFLTDDDSLNLFARGAGTFRVFTSGTDYAEETQRMFINTAGEFGINLVKAGRTGAATDIPLSDFHVGAGALFETVGALSKNAVVISSANSPGVGGLVLTNDPLYTDAGAEITGFKFVAENCIDDDTTFAALKIGVTKSDAPSLFDQEYMIFNGGYVTIGSHTTGNEKLTVDGVVSYLEQGVTPSTDANYGKVYPKASDNNLYYLDSLGNEYLLNGGGVTSGTGVIEQIAFFDSSNSITGAGGLEYDVSEQTLIVPNLQVNGTTTTIESETVVIEDPIFTLGGTSDNTVNDAKDRGIEFRWYDGEAKNGFFGLKAGTQRFTFIPDGTNTLEQYTGFTGDVEFNTAYLQSIAITPGAGDTKMLLSNGIGVGAWTSIDDLDPDLIPDAATDYVMTWDASEGKHKKVFLDAIGGSGGAMPTLPAPEVALIGGRVIEGVDDHEDVLTTSLTLDRAPVVRTYNLDPLIIAQGVFLEMVVFKSRKKKKNNSTRKTGGLVMPPYDATGPSNPLETELGINLPTRGGIKRYVDHDDLKTHYPFSMNNHYKVTSDLLPINAYEYWNNKFYKQAVIYRDATNDDQSVDIYCPYTTRDAGDGQKGTFRYSPKYKAAYFAFRYIQWDVANNRFVEGPLSKTMSIYTKRHAFIYDAATNGNSVNPSFNNLQLICGYSRIQ